MTTPMAVVVQETLSFPPVDGLTVRGTFDGGALSSDIGPLLLCGIDRQIVLGMDHSEDAAHGRQEETFLQHHYGSYCYLPLFLFEGISGQLITTALRSGKRLTGEENAAIVKRVLKRLRAVWPKTHIILRGDGHFANPELMQLAMETLHINFLFGLAGNAVLSPLAKPFVDAARQLHATRCAYVCAHEQTAPSATRTQHDLENYRTKSWPRAFRLVLMAEFMSLGGNPRYGITSLDIPTPESLYRDLYCARGQDENQIKMIKNDLASDIGAQQNHLCPASK